MRLISGKRVGERKSDPDGFVGDNYGIEFRSHHRRHNKTAVHGTGCDSICNSFRGSFCNPELDLGKSSREFRKNPAENGFRPVRSGANQQFASRSPLKILKILLALASDCVNSPFCFQKVPDVPSVLL